MEPQPTVERAFNRRERRAYNNPRPLPLKRIAQGGSKLNREAMIERESPKTTLKPPLGSARLLIREKPGRRASCLITERSLLLMLVSPALSTMAET